MFTPGAAMVTGADTLKLPGLSPQFDQVGQLSALVVALTVMTASS
jgi:hypothetical protein